MNMQTPQYQTTVYNNTQIIQKKHLCKVLLDNKSRSKTLAKQKEDEQRCVFRKRPTSVLPKAHLHPASLLVRPLPLNHWSI